MRKLTKPIEDVGDVLIECISNYTDLDLKNRLEDKKTLIEDASEEFENATINVSLHTIESTDGVGLDVTTKEMTNLYDHKFVKKPGRPIYEKLRSAAINDRCPLCGLRMVSTLDHHLPKADYPALAITPINLIPACSDCNKTKLKAVPTKAEEETLHPYFDDVESDLWLYAEVIESSPAAFRFFVNPPAIWDGLKGDRVQNHFDVFKLNKLYVSHAAEELTNIRKNLIDLYSKTGSIGVRSHLQDQANSRRAAFINSWQTSIYQAMADSNWFCDGGFK